jgi:hypothetical protein
MGLSLVMTVGSLLSDRDNMRNPVSINSGISGRIPLFNRGISSYIVISSTVNQCQQHILSSADSVRLLAAF